MCMKPRMLPLARRPAHQGHPVSPADRLAVVRALAGGDNRALIFTRTKHGAHRLARQLAAAGGPAAELHGDLTQSARTRNLASFSSDGVVITLPTPA
jgi:superfamily II DNA/RNA helicase